MHESRDGQPCDVEIYRRWQGPVIADGGDGQEPLSALLVDLLTQRGFVERTTGPFYRWYELPPGLGEAAENAHATRALVALDAAGYRVAFDPELYDRASDTRTMPPPGPGGEPGPGDG
ncbi:hypothetical protein RM780_09800 [Streptomyces sp. DSM 44917]|uniref:Uncharacterized protein n=1 Tax=Streptomyces boetiae TaxID=3075541 RepID=A0ABU2L6R4_9ACTN|nr:hypothetical protein [Streptomyces sp. DSM 44917]MDT0307255.1 hypothetical protein [Streptomyces sp. DSM 44917]